MHPAPVRDIFSYTFVPHTPCRSAISAALIVTFREKHPP
jgi:hypothetical protein